MGIEPPTFRLEFLHPTPRPKIFGGKFRTQIKEYFLEILISALLKMIVLCVATCSLIRLLFCIEIVLLFIVELVFESVLVHFALAML